ncbi:MAG: SusC/RagA family TonB-linked outer membrane protein [Saprospiraceae bacterium]|jgi:TonB-linked SusC/RagA family outer membrane protein|nr:SusC/RagA family TonB-linked outer membrane protein [Saprospiraceae bacterium]MBX7163847.1 SusC/RagA family TonB-linked outer membrane protein [Saprospiraceae bacterium]
MKRSFLIFFSLLLFALTAHAQRVIKGTITDKKGDPVIGANVVAKGTTVGTVTDIDGRYMLSVPEGTTALVVSYTGYTNQELALGASNIADGSLEEGILLAETVVSALGVKRNKSDVPYANQTVSSDELNTTTSKSVLNSLQGKTAGVKINQASGATGASTRIVLRGETSLTQGNNALIVVDGVPINNSTASGGGGVGKDGDRDNYVDFGNRANDLNPDDVESVTILKGPSATSLYGSRGGSGVILITTKKGKSNDLGRPNVSLSTSYSSDNVYLIMKQQQQFGSGYQSCGGCGGGINIFMGENFAWGAPFDGRLIPWTAQPADEDGNLLPLKNGKYEQLVRPYSSVKNNLRNFFDIGSTKRINVGIDGATDKFNYLVSYTNFNVDGIVPFTNLKKNSFLINVGSNFSKKFSTGFSLNYVKVKQRGATEGGYPFGYSSGTPAYSFALQTPSNIPFEELRDYNSPYHDFRGFYGQYSINPYFILDQQKLLNNVDNIISSISAKYAVAKDLNILGQVSTNVSTGSIQENIPKFTYERALSWSDGELSDFGSPRENYSLGGYKEKNETRIDLIYDLKANYNWKINESWSLSPTIGLNSIEENYREVTGATVGGLVIPEFYHLTNGVQGSISTNTSSKYRLFGMYANAYLGFKNFVFAEYSARKDWSSTLPKGKRGFFYQGVGLSFVPSNLSNWNDNIVSYLKLRGSIGTAGKDAPKYRLNTYYNLNPIILDYGDDYRVRFPFGDGAGANKSNFIGNPDLKPELSLTTEVGIDIGLIKDRLSLEYTYYIIDSKNQIVDVNIPWSSGFSVIPSNIGRMQNKGHELSLKAKPIKTKNFNWDLFVNFSKNDNVVKTILENEDETDELNIYAGLVHFAGHGSLNLVAAEGKPFGTFKGTTYVYNEGRLVVDGTGNPKQSNTLEYLGSYQADYLMNFGTELKFKNLALNVIFDKRQGGLFFSGTKLSTEFNGTASTTTLNDRKEFVIPNSVDENGDANKANTQAYAYFKGLPASAFLLDASYLKLRELSLSYELSAKGCLSNTGFKSAIISIFGRNLKYWLPSENTFADPEVGGVGGASDAVGIETTTTPSFRSYGAEIRLKF